MTEDQRQVVHNTNDEGLRRFTHDHLKVLAEFTADDCDICKDLEPAFAKLAAEERYRAVLFVRLDAAENPVARHLMAEQSAPFFVSYCQGRLLECNTHMTKAEVQAQLDRLLALVPITI